MDARIDIVGGGELVLVLKENEEMHVWESLLLEFDGVYLCNRSTKDSILHDAVEESVLFQPKHLSNEFRVIQSFLPGKQLPLHLWPIWVCCHHDEKINLLIVLSNGH